MTLTVDVAVVGSGCAGLFLAKFLRLQEKRSCAIVDVTPFGQFSSTKNQGWVHGGALYAAKGQAEVAIECANAYHYFEEQHADAIHGMRAFHLFTAADLEIARERLRAVPSIRFEVQGLASVPEPLLKNAAFAGAAEVDDRPFDTHKVLSKVLLQARDAGAIVLPVEDARILQFQRLGEHWSIRAGTELLKARALVLASGTLIPRLAESIAPSISGTLEVQKIEVLSIRRPITSSLLATPIGDLGAAPMPNVCPFLVNDVRGVTVCITGDDVRTSDATREQDFEPRPDSARRFSISLVSAMPSVLELLDGEPAPASIYVCQKLRRSSASRTDDRSEIIIEFEKADARLARCYALYPGKFTASPIIARRFARVLGETLVNDDDPRVESEPIDVSIARQRYLSTGDFHVVSRHGDLVFLP